MFLPFLVLLVLTWPTAAQWGAPLFFPAGRTLSDYTSGKAEPIRDWHSNDKLVSTFSTPTPSFSITRCAQGGRTEPISPSKETFTSRQGHIAPDGTWQVMDAWSNWGQNRYPQGKQTWPIVTFKNLVGNDTTGRICWWELYRVSVEQVPHRKDSSHEALMTVTLLGGNLENYFPSMPFIIDPSTRADGQNVTWWGSGRVSSGTSASHSGSPLPSLSKIPPLCALFSIILGLVG